MNRVTDGQELPYIRVPKFKLLSNQWYTINNIINPVGSTSINISITLVMQKLEAAKKKLVVFSLETSLERYAIIRLIVVEGDAWNITLGSSPSFHFLLLLLPFSVRPPLENEIRISWEGRVNFRCRRPRFRALVGAGILISRVGHVTYDGKGRCEDEGTRMASNEAMLIGAKTAASARSII